MRLLTLRIRRASILSILLLAVMTAGPDIAWAQEATEEGPNGLSGDEKTESSPAMDEVETAADLTVYGVENRDPVALISAARILIENGTVESDATDERTDAPDTSDKMRPDVEFTPDGLLDAAQAMATGDETVLALIDETESMQGRERGRVRGPATFKGRVSARSTVRWRLGEFRGGEPAEVRVRGDGDTDLDCYLYDENGNRIDSDTDHTDYCILRWWPRWTGPFRLYIRNLGPVWNGYYGVTN